jgi:hypothetical protein
MLSLCTASAWSATGPMDFLFQPGGQVPKQQPVRKFGEYSAVSLVAIEAGAVQNQQPLTIKEQDIVAMLEDLTFDRGDGRSKPLFDREEARVVADELSRAFAKAEPGQDVVVMSTSRRNEGAVSLPTTVALRAFVSAQQINFIVGESRADLLSMVRHTGIAPSVNFGSRQTASAVRLSSRQAEVRRADWISFHLGSGGMSHSMAESRTSPKAQPNHSQAPRDEGFYREQAARLEGLRMLHEKRLLTDEEYQRKRAAIVDAM